jgi:hypothetical protein
MSGLEGWYDALAWLEAHQGLASWVQAAGIILAIVAAFRMTRKRARHEKAERISDAARHRADNLQRRCEFFDGILGAAEKAEPLIGLVRRALGKNDAEAVFVLEVTSAEIGHVAAILLQMSPERLPSSGAYFALMEFRRALVGARAVLDEAIADIKAGLTSGPWLDEYLAEAERASDTALGQLREARHKARQTRLHR